MSLRQAWLNETLLQMTEREREAGGRNGKKHQLHLKILSFLRTQSQKIVFVWFWVFVHTRILLLGYIDASQGPSNSSEHPGFGAWGGDSLKVT